VPGHTERILNILEVHGVSAAFFCIGKRVEASQQLVRRMHEAGHLIGNHSYWHQPTFDLQPASRIFGELEATDKVIEHTIGLRPLYFRPPYGVTNPMVATAVRRGGYETIGWSIRSFDTVIDDRTRLYNRLTRSLKAGDIILLHDQGPCTADVLPDLLRHIVSLGLKIVRLDQLLNKKAYA
jgi:peptidoglycan/xylan/chitin deacetylase (PgdA/CDA1 family)